MNLYSTIVADPPWPYKTVRRRTWSYLPAAIALDGMLGATSACPLIWRPHETVNHYS